MQAAEAMGHGPCRRICLGGFTIAQLSSPKEEQGRKWRTDDDGVVGLVMPCYSSCGCLLLIKLELHCEWLNSLQP